MEGTFIRTSNTDFKRILSWLVVHSFEMPESHIGEGLDSFIANLKDDLMTFVEPIYVDKVYRDSYYTYYASKSSNVPKNCIRISFFEDEGHQINEGPLDFTQYEYLKEHYRGFLVIRPTLSSIIGRNVISPAIVKNNGFIICKTPITSNVGGFKVVTEAFPAASQDAETMTCAETTVWAMMEYFGNRYPEYTPLLPSTIVNILKQTTIERQLPSHGLTEDNLSYIAKSCGFGSQLYHRNFFPDFNNILSCYIESGIPIMVALSNKQYISENETEENFLGHAVLCIGHENITERHIDNAVATDLGSGVRLVDFDNIEKKFVFIDDNFPPYQMDDLEEPTKRYSMFFGNGQGWEHCQIDHFVAPLYHKVYLDPTVAKEYIKSLITSPLIDQIHNTEITLRVFLCSTRSYLDYVMKSSMSDDMKRAMLQLTLPRFIWVAELSDRNNMKMGNATGAIILDATECRTEHHNALLVSFCGGNVLYKENQILSKGSINMNPFKMYQNLK